MCNLYTQTKSVDEVARVFRELQVPLVFPDGLPNLQPRDIAITDSGAIVRASGDGSFELVVRRWSWPGPGGKPVYNFRSDGREFSSGRCLIVADGFYEFTAPADPKPKRKDRWLFTWGRSDEAMIGIAGLVRDSAGPWRGLHHADLPARGPTSRRPTTARSPCLRTATGRRGSTIRRRRAI